MYGIFFQIEALISLKIHGYPQFSFLDTKGTC